jgi:hypothetical protein
LLSARSSPDGILPNPFHPANLCPEEGNAEESKEGTIAGKKNFFIMFVIVFFSLSTEEIRRQPFFIIHFLSYPYSSIYPQCPNPSPACLLQ